MKQTIYKMFAAILLVGALSSTAGATIIYDTWTTNENGTGNYEVTATLNGGVFDVSLTVDPWNAELLGFFIDLGAVTISDDTVTNQAPMGKVTLWATDTTSNSCASGGGCNLNGLSPSLASPDSEWEWVFNFGDTGFDSIQTFSFSIAANGATEADWGIVGIRSQVLCSGDDVLPGDSGDCKGSDKSYGSSTPHTSVPEPASLALLGLGLLGMGLVGRRKA